MATPPAAVVEALDVGDTALAEIVDDVVDVVDEETKEVGGTRAISVGTGTVDVVDGVVLCSWNTA
jgi:hypothetical protein